MQYEINGSIMPTLEITLNKDEVLWTEQGGMSWMNDGIKLSRSVDLYIYNGVWGRASSVAKGLFYKSSPDPVWFSSKLGVKLQNIP